MVCVIHRRHARAYTHTHTRTRARARAKMCASATLSARRRRQPSRCQKPAAPQLFSIHFVLLPFSCDDWTLGNKILDRRARDMCVFALRGIYSGDLAVYIIKLDTALRAHKECLHTVLPRRSTKVRFHKFLYNVKNGCLAARLDVRIVEIIVRNISSEFL